MNPNTMQPIQPITTSTRQPTVFIPHGAGPCFFMTWNPVDAWDNMAHFLKTFKDRLPAQPKAILMVSAHWLAEDFAVTSGVAPGLIFDYYGFPEHTYALQYPAPGSPAMAQRVTQLLQAAGIASSSDANRGFDHGMFIPLMLMFPQADIPVVQLSLRQDLSASAHVAVGQALETLRDEGVLIIGSGMSYHNMRGYGKPSSTAPSVAFDQWLTTMAAADMTTRNQGLSEWMQAPSALLCHPSGHEEHLLPLMVVAGAAGQDRGQKLYTEKIMETQLSAFSFG